MLEWRRGKPKEFDKYLCAVITPCQGGTYNKDFRTLLFDGESWRCEGMIVVAWAEEPMWPDVTDFVPV